MSVDQLSVRRADVAEAGALAALMGAAFMDDPVSGWIFPDAQDRARVHAGFFRVFVDLAFNAGTVYTTDGYAGVTLWLDVDITQEQHDDAELGQRLVEACGANAERFAILDSLMSAGHPSHQSHAYLPFIAVAPDRHGQGVGSALLKTRLAELDSQGRPAYLEASSPRNRDLYARLGFERIGATIDLPGGPSLYPMWRPAAG